MVSEFLILHFYKKKTKLFAWKNFLQPKQPLIGKFKAPEKKYIEKVKMSLALILKIITT